MSSPGTLRDWRKVTWRLTSDLAQVAELAQKLGASELAAEAEELRVRVLERRFTIAVVGEFKRGKSTFINALLGEEILPADILPTTATVNRVTYGLRPSVVLTFRDGRPDQGIELHALQERVTKLTEASTRAAAEIREAVVSYPVRFCKNDVDIVDTPGLGDEATMTAVTMELLPQVDAAVLVVMADSPFSETEGRFLDRLLDEGISHVIFVVTAIDRIRRAEDRQRVLQDIRRRIHARIAAYAESTLEPGSEAQRDLLERFAQVRVFGLSARQALEASEEHDGEGVVSSGLPAFEGELEAFLTSSDHIALQRRMSQLAGLCRRLVDLDPSDAGAQDRGTVDGELAELETVLGLLDHAVDRQRRASGDLVARYVVRAEPTLAGLSGKASRVVGLRLDKAKSAVARAWPAGYPKWVNDSLDDIRGAAVRAGGFTGKVALGESESDLVDLHDSVLRLVRAVDYVLRHVEGRLAALGRGERELRLPESALEGTEPLELGEDDFLHLGERMMPSDEEFRDALVHDRIGQALEAYGRTSQVDRFLALDFGGLEGSWAKAAKATVLELVRDHLKGIDARRVLEGWLNEALAGAMRPLDVADEAIRRARLELASFGERRRATRDYDQHDRERALQAVARIRARVEESIAAVR